MMWSPERPSAFAIMSSVLDAQSVPQSYSASSFTMLGFGVALTAKYSRKPGFQENAFFTFSTLRRMPASS